MIAPEMPVASIVSPLFAMASAWRNEPGPLSLVLVTVIVSLRVVSATAQRSANEIEAGRMFNVVLAFG